MTIADAFNEIAVAQGGTASTSGTIAGAIDALNDALAGSDQPSVQTIEGAVRLLGEHVGGGGGGGTEHSAMCYDYNISTGEAVEMTGRIYKCAYTYPMTWAKTGDPITKAAPGELLCIDCSDIIVSSIAYTSGTDIPTATIYGLSEMVGDINAFTMPDGELCALLTIDQT